MGVRLKGWRRGEIKLREDEDVVVVVAGDGGGSDGGGYGDEEEDDDDDDNNLRVQLLRYRGFPDLPSSPQRFQLTSCSSSVLLHWSRRQITRPAKSLAAKRPSVSSSPINCSFWHNQAVMGPRWKGKASEAKALANPMSKSVSDLQSSLIKSNSQGILSGSSVLLGSNPEQTDLLNQTCFGRPVITVDKDNQWFQLTLEEAFYLCFSLKCLKIVDGTHNIKTVNELWDYMISKKESFPDCFKAYSHLRAKNWVVRSGCQYGVDFVAYRHHPSLVHSEYSVLVFSDRNANDRLRVWSDFQCTLRLCGSVAKTLLILYVNKNGESVIGSSPSCLDGFSVDERTVTRWSPERCREDQLVGNQ
ncbi:hypothetical protein QVD17_36390 [Tagetes erecta]|uniref:tRNA-intron lyase n=1 Tax=Tagetes erecta TaxID=13708 RepID=A0AAD8NIZ1_TARER|nr:hypothetical protein QVD17_36390 [Tagetes erecta]